VLAQQARTVAAAVDGRLVLGIGLSHKIVIEDMFGYDFSRPILHMREYLEVLLPLLDGHPVSFSGTTVRANIGLTTPSPGRIPVVVAALGAQMLRLAGERTDGTVLWMTGPATVRDHIMPVITAAAEKAGRPSPRVVCILPVCVTDDPDGARERAARVFAIYGDLPSYRAMLDREGAAGPADVAIVGDEGTVGAHIAALAEVGVTDFVAGEYTGGADGTRTRAFLRSVIT
jgi:F420-dependent oxidoreductase-like protein